MTSSYCFDVSGNAVDCTDTTATTAFDLTAGQQAASDAASGPVSLLASSPSNNGGSALSSVIASLGGLATSISTAVSGGPRPVSTGVRTMSPTVGGSSSMLLLVAALVIAWLAWLAFGRRRA